MIFKDTGARDKSGSSLGGGEFGIDVLGYGVQGTDLLSFCLELNEHLSFNREYSFSIDTAAQRGGTNNNVADPGSTASPKYDTLSKGSEYLYDLFHRGRSDASVWNNYSYDGSSANVDDATALQYAFWVLEDEKETTDGPLFAPAGNKFLTLVETEFGSLGDAKTNFSDWGNSIVRVMNIWEGQTLKQSQIVAVPESGLVLLMLSGALGVMGFVRRRRAASAEA